MDVNQKEFTETVLATTLQSDGMGFVLQNPATFKVGDVAYKLAVQGLGLCIVAVDKPDKLVSFDISKLLAKAVEEFK